MQCNAQHLHMKCYALKNGVLRSTYKQETYLPQRNEKYSNYIEHPHAA